MFSWCRALILTGHVELHESGQNKHWGKQREGWGGQEREGWGGVSKGRSGEG